jgi:Glucosamine 6-phosphate synthetase, contains amidotransferase and phosphosugar isomerase domains
MCGIFGVIGSVSSSMPSKQLFKVFQKLALLSEARGKEAAGCAILSDNEITVYKKPIRVKSMLKTKEFKQFIANKKKLPIVIIGHTRLVTNGSQAEESNNQPVVTEHCVGIHNGIIINEKELMDNHSLIPQSNLDTELLYKLIEKNRLYYGDLANALKASFQEIKGSASIAFFSDQDEILGLATNTGSLFYVFSEKLGLGFFASEKYFLEKTLKSYLSEQPGNELVISRLAAQTGLLIDYKEIKITSLSLNELPIIHKGIEPINRIDIRYNSLSNRDLKRCTKCLLPETFPLIHFDQDGVCNICNAYIPQKVKSEQELRQQLEPYRSKNGEPDCILALSGGRDSSYGLHYLKCELGMNPITFTYDWGMVTDIARRNIANICGKLGVDNIIRSPDIAAKRRNIRLNIEAWLRRPELGMIPLFMAGDKQFFHIARQLRKETGIQPVIFCAGNPLERTEFKTGFCGIKESAHDQRLWNYSIKNKIDLLIYYGKNYLINPAYFNRSMWDTFHAYYSTYIAKDDFLYLYHYIKWDEKIIADTLESEYNWEKANDTQNTWRIGDGTAAFYNYIYYTVAGFSEHDTFRSNQIREGLITREEGLRLIQQDNIPRYDAMNQYALTIGLNLDEALTIINRMPKLK